MGNEEDRNCSCGSGKLYRDCCENKIISADYKIIEELKHVQTGMYTFASNQYNESLNRGYHYMAEHLQPVYIPNEILEEFYWIWYISSNKDSKGKSLLQISAEYNSQFIKKKRIKSIVQNWKEAKFTIGFVRQISNASYHMEDFLTKETYTVISNKINDQSFQIAVLLPYNNESYIKFGPYINLILHSSSEVFEILEDKFRDSSYMNPSEFMRDSFFELLNDVFFLYNNNHVLNIVNEPDSLI